MKKRLFLLPLLSLSLFVSGCGEKNSNPDLNTNTNDNEGQKEEDKKPIDPIIEEKNYTITWNNYDGTLLNTSSVKEGEIPSYSGTPTRNETENYSYTFSGWTPAITNATSNVTYTATFEEHEKSSPIPLSTIAEVRELCKNVKNLNSAGIGIDNTVKVKIQGWAFHKMTLVKTAKAYGYNVSYPNKVFIGDSTGYIACASNNATGSLYYKVNDWAGNENSKYEVTGYISMYMNQPEIYIPDNDANVGYKYDSSLSVSCDFSTIASVKTIEEYYNDFSDICYNCAGHGYRDIVKINNVSIVDVVDADTYIGTNGDKVIKIKKGVCGLAKGRVYNITGLVQTNNYIPSIALLASEAGDATYTTIKEESAIEKTIPEYISTFSSLPYDDTNANLGDTIKKFQYAYKITGYISAYLTNYKHYVTIEPNFNNSDDYPTRESAICVRGAVTLRNDNCWNVSEDEIILFAAVGGYLNENTTVSIYVSPILYENMTYNKTKYHEIKNFVFDSLVPEFIEE